MAIPEACAGSQTAFSSDRAECHKTFRDLAETAKAIGMTKLAHRLAGAFRDDLRRNGIAHADYVIWSDGVRLRRRNGGTVYAVPHEEVIEFAASGSFII